MALSASFSSCVILQNASLRQSRKELVESNLLVVKLLPVCNHTHNGFCVGSTCVAVGGHSSAKMLAMTRASVKKQHLMNY